MTKRERILQLRNGVKIKSKDILSFREEEEYKKFIKIENSLIDFLKSKNLSFQYDKHSITFEEITVKGQYLPFNTEFDVLRKHEDIFFENYKKTKECLEYSIKQKIDNYYRKILNIVSNIDCREWEFFDKEWYTTPRYEVKFVYNNKKYNVGTRRHNEYFDKEWKEHFEGIGSNFVHYCCKDKVVTTTKSLLNYKFNNNIEFIVKKTKYEGTEYLFIEIISKD